MWTLKHWYTEKDLHGNNIMQGIVTMEILYNREDTDVALKAYYIRYGKLSNHFGGMFGDFANLASYFKH